jgi:mRNA-degrading endonuclease RelE of RelBE toxin-antitoxin system
LNVNTRLIAEGSAFRICEIVKNERSRVGEFFKELPEDKRSRLTRLIVFMADRGLPRDERKFKHEEDGIFAIKQGKVRIYCFFDSGRLILLTHGTLKKKQKADPKDLKRARSLREAYLKAKRLS